MSDKLSIAFSPCPNDTFIFSALVHGLAEVEGLSFEPEILADVETLNAWAMEAKIDVSKLSFHALGHVLDNYVLLDAGSALGRGCGPLLVSAGKIDPASLQDEKIAIPGRLTTAAMLMRLYAPKCRRLVEMRFDKIMAAVKSGEVAAGVIIHESRFTYQREGLQLLVDLGSWWEKSSGRPIPLGGIAARRSLGEEKIAKIDAAIKKSIAWAYENSAQNSSYVKQHAQELDDNIIADHINLYVNSFSRSLGEEGAAAIVEFLRRGKEAAIFPDHSDLPVVFKSKEQRL